MIHKIPYGTSQVIDTYTMIWFCNELDLYLGSYQAKQDRKECEGNGNSDQTLV
jgi:hypothetical protein